MWRLRSALGNGIWYCELRLLWSVLMTQFWVSWNQWRLSAGASAWAWSTLLPQFRGFHPLVLPRVGGILFLRLDDVATRYNYVTKIKLNNFFHDGKNETNQKRCSNEEFNLHSCIVFDFGLRLSGKQHQQSHDRFIDFIVCSDALLDFQCRFHSHFPWCFGHFGCEWLLNCCVCRCFDCCDDCYHCCDDCCDCCHCCFHAKNPISNSNLTWYFNQSKSFISNAWFFSW